MSVVDLNADVGEGFDSDSELIQLVTSANIACGFHAGDERTMRVAAAAAVAAQVVLGAHVSYRDRDEFGRRALAVDAARLADDAVEQIEALQAAAASVGGRVAYLKPHGALYHRASSDLECAEALIAAAAGARGGPLAVVGFPGSLLLERAGEAGLLAVAEGFADRAYATDGSLVPRTESGALLTPDAAARQAVAIAEGTVGGGVRSICVHGDTADAAALARRVRDALVSAHVELRAFT
jgi:5-oxoprolinase (ATP-hydrolysing) subunit A